MSAMGVIKILLVEDQQLVREGLKGLLALHDDELQVVGEASDGAEALEWLAAASAESMPDVILSDMRMPRLDGDTLLQALRDVHGGGTALRPSLTTRMEAKGGDRAFTAADHPDPLSPKELQVLRLVASGRSNTEIASLLGNSEGVIKNHCSAIFSKMGVRDRTQAVLRAIDLGWI
jgi:DNA-binding NarL/FixJ family response regulator